MNLFDLKDQVAVVVGGTGRLGGIIAEGLSRAGAMTMILGRNAERGEARVAEIRKRGGEAAFFATDVLQRSDLASAREQIQKKWGVPSILVNAAGGNDPRASGNQAFEAMDLEGWRAVVDLNLVGGAVLPCQEFGPAMIKHQRGSIINIASVSAHVPLSRVAAYSAAKAAVVNLTQFLAREWAKDKVRVNSITPGFFPAEQNRRLLFHEDGSLTPRAQAIIAHTPMGRFGREEELLGAAIFLASDRASGFVTGTDLCVDGGFLCQTI